MGARQSLRYLEAGSTSTVHSEAAERFLEDLREDEVSGGGFITFKCQSWLSPPGIAKNVSGVRGRNRDGRA